MNRDWLTLRAGYVQAEMTVPVISLTALSDAWHSVGYSDVADNVVFEDDVVTFVELGFQIDYENLLFIGEFTHTDLSDTPSANTDAFYIMGGYRIDDWLIHLTYGANDDSKDTITGHVPLGVGFDPLIAGTNGITEANVQESSYYTVGARWDFHESASLKFEYTDYTNDTFSSQDASVFRTALVTVF